MNNVTMFKDTNENSPIEYLFTGLHFLSIFVLGWQAFGKKSRLSHRHLLMIPSYMGNSVAGVSDECSQSLIARSQRYIYTLPRLKQNKHLLKEL